MDSAPDRIRQLERKQAALRAALQRVEEACVDMESQLAALDTRTRVQGEVLLGSEQIMDAAREAGLVAERELIRSIDLVEKMAEAITEPGWQPGDPPPLMPPTDGSVSGSTLVRMQKRWEQYQQRKGDTVQEDLERGGFLEP